MEMRVAAGVRLVVSTEHCEGVCGVAILKGCTLRATELVEVGIPGCSQPGEGGLAAAGCAVALSTLLGERTSAETSVPSPSCDSDRGPSM